MITDFWFFFQVARVYFQGNLLLQNLLLFQELCLDPLGLRLDGSELLLRELVQHGGDDALD